MPKRIQFPLLCKVQLMGTLDKRNSQQATAEGTCLADLFRKPQSRTEELFLLTFYSPRARQSQGGELMSLLFALILLKIEILTVSLHCSVHKMHLSICHEN